MIQASLEIVRDAVAGSAAAFRCITQLQPAGGIGDKIFPPTYEGGKYATEKRRVPGKDELADCVLLDSVQSQANRMEIALLDAWEAGRIPLPVITVDFSGNDLGKDLRVTSLEAPHRIADAILRDSLFNGQAFRKSEIGKRLDDVDLRNATVLFELCPTSLLFGMWDSTGPKGGLGAKFQRAIVSEIIGLDASIGCKTSSRLDPLGARAAVKVLKQADGSFTVAESDKAKGAVSPAEVNHGNIPPTISDGGVTIRCAIQSTVISLPAIRRLRFPLDSDKRSDRYVDVAAQTASVALGLCAAVLTRERGCDLRSRCQLFPTTAIEWELLDKPGGEPQRLSLNSEQAITILHGAVQAAKDAGLSWMEEELNLKPSPDLVELVRRSQQLAASVGQEGE